MPFMEGRICLITGSTSGIGRATAASLAEMGATVVMANRDRETSEAVREAIRVKTGNPHVHHLTVDLSSQESIRRMATEFTEEYPELHVLINNAGVYLTRRRVTADGLEMSFAVNFLAQLLTVHLLMGVLRRSAPARIVNVAGAYHAKGEIEFDDLQLEVGYTGARANNNAKLAVVLFTYELARRLEGTGVTANCLHPGAVRTGLAANDPDMPRFSRLMLRLARPFLKSPEKGADTSLYLASSRDVEGVTGKYFVGRKPRRSSPASYDTALAKRLWNVGHELAREERSATA